MSDERTTGEPMNQDAAPATGLTPPNRRQMLMFGAAAASTVVTVRPAMAQTIGSVLTCEIPIPDPRQSGSFISGDGKLVPPNTPGAFPPPGRAYTGEEVKRALSGGRLPGTNGATNRAYTNYIRRLQSGMSGFTCYASLQMPR